eukprot:c22941_g1_i1.p1 GENE.c22941_g1_i1~~c22941_g1_i1.p1  ORF type:complete len:439 (-),score=134.01 c22941_g1_i1:296-1612(-)
MGEIRRASLASQSFFRFGDITENYLIGEVIGKGNYAEVRIGQNKMTGEKVAIKVLELKKETSHEILNEIDILARVDDHPHVIQLREIYEKKGRMFIVMELVRGGELFDRIIARQFFSEKDARDLMLVLFTTISHMHAHGIVHRDLKPENILYASPDADSPIKIADFGLAKLWMPKQETSSELKTLCGTPGYVAPEVLKNRQGYTAQCDLWSLGVILYILLCGYPPFQHQQQTKLFKQILKADYQFHSPWWDNISDQAKDLVSKLLVVDPQKRLTPKEALDHPWMLQSQVGGSVDISKLQDYVLRNSKRKFRMLTNALSIAHRLSEVGKDKSPGSTPPVSPSVASANSIRRLSGSIGGVPPPPPGPPPDDDDDDNHNDELRRHSIGNFGVMNADWVAARQGSIVRRSSRAEELKKKKFLHVTVEEGKSSRTEVGVPVGC